MVSVLVPATLIEDGEALPAIGQHATYALRFIDQDHEHAEADPCVAAWSAVAEPLFDGEPRRRQPLGGQEYGEPYWSVLLHAAGWSAGWAAPRPATGPVTVRGTLVADWDVGVPASARISGTITRVQVVSYTVEYASSGQVLEQRVPGTQQLREVSISPRWFTRGAPGPPHARPIHWTGEDGVLVDLQPGPASTADP